MSKSELDKKIEIELYERSRVLMLPEYIWANIDKNNEIKYLFDDNLKNSNLNSILSDVNFNRFKIVDDSLDEVIKNQYSCNVNYAFHKEYNKYISDDDFRFNNELSLNLFIPSFQERKNSEEFKEHYEFEDGVNKGFIFKLRRKHNNIKEKNDIIFDINNDLKNKTLKYNEAIEVTKKFKDKIEKSKLNGTENKE